MLPAVIAWWRCNWGGYASLDSRWTNWVGFVTHKPVTEDYAPVLPWLGDAAVGAGGGPLVAGAAPQQLAGALAPNLAPLVH